MQPCRTAPGTGYNSTATYFFACVMALVGCMPGPVAHDPGDFVEINEAQHYYQFSGTGDTIIVLHGGPGLSHQYLRPQLDALLSSHFTLLYYDQRGSGWSAGVSDTANLTIESFVQDLDLIADYFNIDQMHLLGHSFGGLLAMHYSITYPDQVTSLILVDTDAGSYDLRTPYQVETINSRLTDRQNQFLDSIESTGAFKNYDPASYEMYYRTFLTSYFADPNDTAKLFLGFDSLSVPKINSTNSIVRANLGKYDIHDQLATIHCRTLIMQGTESVFSVEGALAIHERIPQSEIHLFEDCGHFQYIEAPEKFQNLVFSFHQKE